MKVLILTHGTRGDIQPYVALGRALVEAGHKVALAAPPGLGPLADSYGVDFLPIDDGPNILMNDPVIREAFSVNYRGVRGKALAVQIIRKHRPQMAKVLDDMAGVADVGADVVVHHVVYPGNEVAESLGVPSVPVCLQPLWVPTTSFPDPLCPFPVPSVLNRFSYFATRLWFRLLIGSTASWRSEVLGLPPRHGRKDVFRWPDGRSAPVLQAFSRYMSPGAAYPQTVHTTGFWFLPGDPSWSPPRELVEFVSLDDRPLVYFGFGSMAGRDPNESKEIAVDAARLAGVRAIVVTGWGGIDAGEHNGDVFFASHIPHDWLFPRMNAIVHHGGSGTTGAALAAGRPQVVCPFVLDQPFHAQRMHQLGVAPRPLPQRDMDAQTLGRAVSAATGDPLMAARACIVEECVKTEPGVAGAVDVLESIG